MHANIHILPCLWWRGRALECQSILDGGGVGYRWRRPGAVRDHAVTCAARHIVACKQPGFSRGEGVNNTLMSSSWFHFEHAVGGTAPRHLCTKLDVLSNTQHINCSKVGGHEHTYIGGGGGGDGGTSRMPWRSYNAAVWTSQVILRGPLGQRFPVPPDHPCQHKTRPALSASFCCSTWSRHRYRSGSTKQGTGREGTTLSGDCNGHCGVRSTAVIGGNPRWAQKFCLPKQARVR